MSSTSAPDVREADAPGADRATRRLRDLIAARTGALVGPAGSGTMPTSFLSVVVLNFNGAAVADRCLDHLFVQTYPHREVIVVDNGSSDESVGRLDRRARRGEIVLVRSPTNLGVAGGRNLALRRARGDVVAFLDNDAYPSPTWLFELTAKLESDETIGAVASLVFFDGHKLILNSAGGTLNYRGHGANWCFNVPFEHASLPDEVLYPTGCGMAVRRAVLDRIGEQDNLIPYYGYDDVEVGIRTWQLGSRVVLARRAWVDHEGGYSARFNPNLSLLRERGRIRNALKYFSDARLLAWLAHEPKILVYLLHRGERSVPFRAWGWNLAHLPSAWRRRREGRVRSADFAHLLYPSWRQFPWFYPNNGARRPDPSLAGCSLVLDGTGDTAQLNYGWYEARREKGTPFRWSAADASVFLRAKAGADLKVCWRSSAVGQTVAIRVRPAGELQPIWEERATPVATWESRSFACGIRAGLYELQLRSEPARRGKRQSDIGVGVSRLCFE